MTAFQPSSASFGAAPLPTIAELKRAIKHTENQIAHTPVLTKQRATLEHHLKVLRAQLVRASHHAKAVRSSKTRVYVGDKPAHPRLAKRIEKVKARIAAERAKIRRIKKEIAVASGAGAVVGLATAGVGAVVSAGVVAAKLKDLHTCEKLLHRDRHLLTMLQRAVHSGDKKLTVIVEKAAAAADAGASDPSTVVAGYTAPSTTVPEEKSVDQVVAEAGAEAQDPSAADAIDAQTSGETPAGETATTPAEAQAVADAIPEAASEVKDATDDDEKALEVSGSGTVSADGGLFKSPAFWIVTGLGVVGYFSRNQIKSYFSKVS